MGIEAGKSVDDIVTKEEALGVLRQTFIIRPDGTDNTIQIDWEQRRDAICEKAIELGATTFEIIYVDMDTAPEEARQEIFDMWFDDHGDLTLDDLVNLRDSFGLVG